MSGLHLPVLAPVHWVLLLLGAFCSGLSKTGIAGVGIVSVAVFPLLLPPREAVGATLLMLVATDIVAVTVYRREADWSRLWKLFPWTALGVVLGYLAMGHVSDANVKKLIGGILLLLVLFMLPQRIAKSREAARKRGEPDGEADEAARLASKTSGPLSASTGVLAGFATMVANAAGPIMTIYLLALRLPKMAFVGTAAWFFFVVNLFKVPFGIALGTITPNSALLAAALYPGAFAGALLGRRLLPLIPQTMFEWLAIVFTALAGLKLLF